MSMTSSTTRFVFAGASVGAHVWQPLARALMAGAPGTASLTEAPPPAWPEDTGVVWLVVPPADAVAGALLADPACDLARGLDDWCAGVRQALRSQQRRPGQCLLLLAGEVSRDPGAAARACAEHFGVGWAAADDRVMAPATDALRLALADLAVVGHQRARSLFEEVLASCRPLGEPGPDLPPAALNLAAAIARLAQLEADGRRADEATAQRAQLTHALQVASADRDALQAKLAAALAESTAAFDQMHRTQAELESVAKCRLDDAATAAQRLAALQAERQQAEQGLQNRLTEVEDGRQGLLQELAAARGETQALRMRLVEAEKAVEQALTGARDETQALRMRLVEAEKAAEQALTVARDETRVSLEREAVALKKADQTLERVRDMERQQALSLIQLHQVQEELERYYLDNEKLAAAGRDSVALDWSVDRVTNGPVRDEAPHRDANFVFHGLRVGQRSPVDQAVRLVDHHGRAGLALFRLPGGAAPLAAWQVSGQEGDREFMLLVPSDPNTARAMDRLTRTDWLLLQVLAGRVAAVVAERGAALAPRWRATAARLGQELAGLPRRWRCDGVAATAEASGEAVALALEAVDVGGRDLGDVSLRWAPGGAGGPAWLEWLLPASGTPALAAWPLGDDGSPQARLRWRFDKGLSTELRRAQWRGLSSTDRDTAMALFEALPALLRRAPPATGLELGPLATLAETLAPAVRRLVAPARWKQAARALLGRTHP